MFKKNQEVELEILELNMMGHGVAKRDGAVFFVRDALPGEVCLCRIIKCAKNYYVAHVLERRSVSEYRIDPVCRVWRTCGGCVFQNASYELELLTKKRYVEECVKKAGLSLQTNPVLSSRNICRYRNKGQYPVSQADSGIVAGFYAPRSHRVVSIDDCAIQNEAFSGILQTVISFCRDRGVKPYDEEAKDGLLRHVNLRIGEKTGQIMLCLVLTKDEFPGEGEFIDQITSRESKIASIVFNINPDDTNVILGNKERLVWGREAIDDVLCDKRFSLSSKSFYQVNRDGAELLYQTAFQMARVTPDTVLLDLYCGVGTIGQCAAQKPDQKIYGVEIIPQAIENAKFNASQNGLTQTRYICGDASALFDKIKEGDWKSALLILDPPRKGLSADVIGKVIASPVEKILYISCNPVTLTRDIALLEKGGFSAGFLQPVDLFPRTGHVEAVTLITRDDVEATDLMLRAWTK